MVIGWLSKTVFIYKSKLVISWLSRSWSCYHWWRCWFSSRPVSIYWRISSSSRLSVWGCSWWTSGRGRSHIIITAGITFCSLRSSISSDWSRHLLSASASASTTSKSCARSTSNWRQRRAFSYCLQAPLRGIIKRGIWWRGGNVWSNISSRNNWSS